MYYRICENCGAVLDPGERCDCENEILERERLFMKKINQMQREYEFRKTYCREKCEKYRKEVMR